MDMQNILEYHLEYSNKRNYEIMVFTNRIVVQGKFWILRVSLLIST